MDLIISPGLNNYCRLCLASNSDIHWHSILDRCDTKDRLIHCMISESLSLLINLQDSLPKDICSDCFLKVSDIYEFKEKVKFNDEVLKKVYSRNENQFITANNCIHRSTKYKTILSKEMGIILTGDTPYNAQKEGRKEKLRKNIQKCSWLKSRLKSSTSTAARRGGEFNNELNCIVCSKSFSTELKLHQHQQFNHFVCTNPDTYKRYRCDLCDKAYRKLIVLLDHKATHSGTKQFQCSICNKAFFRKRSLKEHISIHKGERNYSCEICGRSFSKSSNLTIHKLTHSSIKSHVCTFCSKGFHLANNLHEHLRIHTGEKPFLCSECGRSFSRRTHLKIHLRAHTGEKPYKCDQCDKAFKQSHNLVEHKRLHTGERPFSCKTCNKRFARTALLKKHERTHTGERNHKCIICEMAFTESSSLKRHLKSKHKN